MLDMLKDKRVWIGLVVAILFVVGIIGAVSSIDKSKDTEKSNTKIEIDEDGNADDDVNNNDEGTKEPYSGEGLTIAGDEESDKMQEDSVKAPTSWSGTSGQTKEPDKSGQTGSNAKDESKEPDDNKQDEDDNKEDNDNIEEDETLESEDVSYGRIF